MKVSAIIPTYNRRKYIERSVDSVLAQSLPVDEVIVVDDGSSDGTAEMLEEKYGSSVRVIRQENAGVAGARRTGILAAGSEWIAFLDSDDSWMPDRNRVFLDATTKLPEDVAWIFGDLRVVTDAGEGPTLHQEYGLTVNGSPEIFADSLSVQFPFQFGLLQGSFIRRNALIELKCFTEGLRSDDDLLAGFQVACKYRVAAIPDIVGKYFRTADLADSSVLVNGVYGKDHYRARMLAFASVIETRKLREPWNSRYASEARDLCKLLAKSGDYQRNLAFEQFRYGAYSLKGIAFFFAAILGTHGIRTWDKFGEWRRRKQVANSESATFNNGLRSQIQSASQMKSKN